MTTTNELPEMDPNFEDQVERETRAPDSDRITEVEELSGDPDEVRQIGDIQITQRQASEILINIINRENRKPLSYRELVLGEELILDFGDLEKKILKNNPNK